MTHLLITGGAGYIGSRLSQHLLNAGHAVTAFDVCWFGAAASLGAHPRFRLIQDDARDLDALKWALEDGPFGPVRKLVHLAGLGDVGAFEPDPRLAESVDLDAFAPLAETAKAAGVRRLVYVSSGSVYGDPGPYAVDEDDPLLPQSGGGAHRAACEAALKRLDDFDFTGVVARPAPICGAAPRLRLDFGVNALVRQALEDGVIRVAAPNARRSFAHIDDVCDAIALLLATSRAKVAGAAFNIASGALSFAEIAEAVRRVIEAAAPERGPIAIETTDDACGPSLRLSTRKAERLLGFRPRYGVEDAARSVLDAIQARSRTEGRATAPLAETPLTKRPLEQTAA